MIAPLASIAGSSAGIEKAGVVLLTTLCATLLAYPRARLPRRREAALIGAVAVLAPALLLSDIWQSSPIVHLRAHPAQAAAIALGGIVLMLALAALLHRRPAALPIAAFIALPFRLPIAAGGSESNLLVPLYLVIAAGACARLYGALRPGAPPSSPGPLDRGLGDQPLPPGTAPGRSVAPRGRTRRAVVHWRRLADAATLQKLLAASVALYGLQALYSHDFAKALENVTFFLAPFTLLFLMMRDAPWSRRLLYACLGCSAVLSLTFAGIGFAELARQRLFLNSKLVQANEYGGFFRVNSVFFDPNIYGRYLAVVLVALTAALFGTQRRIALFALAAALAWLWGGLLSSFSQSSMAALLLGLAVIAAWRWDALSTAYVTLGGALLGLVVVLLAPASAHFGLTGEGGSADNATSGRASLVTGGLALFADRPLAGYGSGSFALEYRHRHSASQRSAVSASHTIPVTIAAEQGLIGLLIYAALLFSSLAVVFRGAGRSPPRLALAACYTALLLHTMAYADFLEDPTTWALLAVAIALGAAVDRPRRSAR